MERNTLNMLLNKIVQDCCCATATPYSNFSLTMGCRPWCEDDSILVCICVNRLLPDMSKEIRFRKKPDVTQTLAREIAPVL